MVAVFYLAACCGACAAARASANLCSTAPRWLLSPKTHLFVSCAARSFESANVINNNLDTTCSELQRLIHEINATSSATHEKDDAIQQITQLLQEHVTALQDVERATETLEQRIQESKDHMGEVSALSRCGLQQGSPAPLMRAWRAFARQILVRVPCSHCAYQTCRLPPGTLPVGLWLLSRSSLCSRPAVHTLGERYLNCCPRHSAAHTTHNKCPLDD